MFNAETDLNKYLYHFTRYTTALEYILPSHTIRFSPFLQTNDPRESKDWMFSMTGSLLTPELPNDDEIFGTYMDTQSEFNSYLKRKTKLFCLTRDVSLPFEDCSVRGYSRARMWAQYADNHKGVCLIFDKKKLHKAIQSNLKNGAQLYDGPVNYGPVYSYPANAFKVKYEDIKNKGLKESARNHLNTYYKELFFEKYHDWKDETEYRWVIFNSDNEGYETFYYQDALVCIILGADFPPVYETIIQNYCRKFKVRAARMFWTNGTPSVVPAYNPETNESFISQVF
jgi:hypothetical protein